MMHQLAQLNWIAVLVAALAGYFPGAVWYSPIGFLKPWARELNVDLTRKREGHPGAQVLIGIVPALIAAIVLSLILGPHPRLDCAMLMAVAVAGGFVATSFAIQYLYEQRSLSFWLINSGYHLLQYLIMAVILALWPW